MSDLISREEALMALTGVNLPTDRDKLIALFNERIKALAPVEQTEWISVKDSRKPKIRERVWATDCDGEVWIMYYNDCDCYFNEFGDVFADDIIAWQPITEPSPYKGNNR